MYSIYPPVRPWRGSRTQFAKKKHSACSSTGTTTDLGTDIAKSTDVGVDGGEAKEGLLLLECAIEAVEIEEAFEELRE